MTDGRFSGGTHGLVVGHISPEAFDGGPIAVIQMGDMVTIDSERNILQIEISEEEIKNRLKNWKQPEPRFKSGVLAKYAKLVQSAAKGAITNTL